MNKLSTGRILIVDDEESIRFTFSEFLKEEGYTVFTAETLADGLQLLKDLAFDALYLDVNLGSENSIEKIPDLKRIQPDCKIVMITGGINSKYMASARKYGAHDYIVKPVYKPSLLYSARKAVSH